jgi:uncharacterized protein YbaR (Trm112 family)
VIDPGLLEILVCPENRTPLHLADDALVARLNRAIGEKRLNNRAGQPVKSPIEGGLIREDRAILYPIVEGIPVLLTSEAIPLEQVEQADG